MSGPDETRTQPPEPDGATRDFDPSGATAEFANAAPVSGYVVVGNSAAGRWAWC